MMMSTKYMRVRSWMIPWTVPLWAPTRYTGQQFKRWWHNILSDSRRSLVLTTAIDFDVIFMWGQFMKFPFNTYKKHKKWSPDDEVVVAVTSWCSHIVWIQLTKRVGFYLFLFLDQNWHSSLVVEVVGSTWTWSPINFFGPPYLTCVFNTILKPHMYFWKLNDNEHL